MCKRYLSFKNKQNGGAQKTVINASNASSLPKILQNKIHTDTSGHVKSGGFLGKIVIRALQNKMLKRKANNQNGYNPSGDNTGGNTTLG